MKTMSRFTLILIVLLITATVQAEPRILKGGSGVVDGNYYEMMNDIKSYCDESLTDAIIENMISSGSVETIIGLGNKVFTFGMLQEDVLQYFAKRDPKKVNRNRLKIISGLHLESAHLLIPKGYKPKGAEKSGWAKAWSVITFASEEAPKGISLQLLKNQTLGSWGGSMVSAKALSFFLELNMNVVEIPEGKRTDPGIPLLLVGGQPYAPVEAILATGKYNLVPIDFSQLSTRAPFYIKDEINYRIGGKITSIPTFAVRAFLVGKSFRKKARNQPMIELSTCMANSLADLADDDETNPNWATVYELEEDGEQTNWSYFEFN